MLDNIHLELPKYKYRKPLVWRYLKFQYYFGNQFALLFYAEIQLPTSSVVLRLWLRNNQSHVKTNAVLEEN